MWLTDRELLALPPPVFLVEDVLPERAFAVLAGDSGLGKTYIALDIAFSIARGAPWQSCVVKSTPVAYVIAEGIGGMPQRVAAWRKHNGVAEDDSLSISFWPSDVQLGTRVGLDIFAGSLHALDRPPGLVVIDTLARCFVGLDENSAKDMGLFVAGVDRIRAIGAAVLVIHHSGHLKERERGSTALRGAADTFLMLERSADGGLVLSCRKQREADAFEPMGLRLRAIPLDDGRESCIVEASAVPKGLGAPAKWNVALERLPAGGASFAEWCAASGLPPSTFKRMLKMMIETGRVERAGNVYVPRKANGAG